MKKIMVLDLDNVLIMNRFDCELMRKLWRRLVKMLLFVYELMEFLLGLIYTPKLRVNRVIQEQIASCRRSNIAEFILLTDRSLLGLFNVIKKGFLLDDFRVVYVRKNFLNQFFFKKLKRLYPIRDYQQIWQHREIKPHQTMVDAVLFYARKIGVKPKDVDFVDDLLLMRNLARAKGFRAYSLADFILSLPHALL